MLGIYVRTSRDGDKDESPIEQQKKAGIRFAEEHKYRYRIYEDKGVSGYKITEDEAIPFKNRPQFLNLINDIKNGEIEMVWVWEHSRLSRNQYASAYIFNTFERNGTKVFEKDREFRYTDPQEKMFRGLLDMVSEYERSLIVTRITRGLHKRIDDGKRSFGKLYGYKKNGTDSKGYQLLEPVESEIENIKYGYKRLLEGATLRQLTLELYDKKSLDKLESLRLSRYWYKVLRHFVYTGYALNLKGLEILRRFDAFEIDNLSVLNDSEYYTKSVPYPRKIISIEKWIKVVERLRINRQIRREYRNKKASSDLATGILKCSECGQKYYSHTHKNTAGEKTYYYVYYKHYSVMSNVNRCSQKKSFIASNVNEIFKLYYFYFYLVFDDTQHVIEESQRAIKAQQLKFQEQINRLEKNEKQLERRLAKFNEALDTTDDTGEIKILARRISDNEEHQLENYESLSKARIELEKLNEQYSGNESLNAYYNSKDMILKFFEEMNVEEQRENLLRITKECLVFGQFILMDTGNVVFLFDTNVHFRFNTDFLDHLDNTEHFKWRFLDYSKAIDLDEWISNGATAETLEEWYYYQNEIRTINDIYVNIFSVEDGKKGINKLLKKLNLDYDISGHSCLVTFVDVMKYGYFGRR
jgi:DNA invertase Pin-like site-specific DNA recombinase